MKKYALLMAAVLVGTFFSCDPKREEEGPQRPNILIILADDAGYADFGFMESEDMLTPNLDRLAQEGVVFTDAHTSASVCSPSRAGLLTGRYQQRFGHEMNLRPHQPMAFDSAQVTIAELLSQNGYSTSIFGKWHLGEAPHQHPNKNGFDHFWGFLAGHRSYFPEPKDSIREDMHLQENGRPSSFQGYLTDAIGDHALQYLEGINQDDPFFMFLSFNAPHTPMEADPMHDSLFKDHPRPVYTSMMYSMDLAIGRIIRKLKEQELYNNSLIFFLSDNGGSIQNNSSVAPWKGFKGNQYEGGTRVPLVVSWPARVTRNPGYDGLTSALDIYATAVAAAGIPEGQWPPLDGVNLLPILENPESPPPHETLFWRKHEMAAARVGDLKLITVNTPGDADTVLYDLQNDPGEVNDLSAEVPADKSMIANKLNEWERGTIEKIWGGNDDWHEVSKIIVHSLMANKEPTVLKPSQLEKNQIKK